MTLVMDNARERIAAELGEAPENLGQVSESAWNALLTEGVLVELHVRRWRAQRRLTTADLGLTVNDQEERAWWDEFLNLGEKRLLPAKLLRQLASVEASARACLLRYSYAVAFGRFVPRSAYQAWKRENERYAANYARLAREIDENWDGLVNQVVRAYRAGARGAYERLTLAGTPPAVDRETFVANFLSALYRAMPTQAEVKASFAYEAELKWVPLPSAYEAERAERERLRAEWDKEFAAKRLEDTALAERQRQLDEMTADIVASARRKKQEEVDGFLRAVVGQLRQTVYNTVVDALASLKKNDAKLVGKSAGALKNLVDTVGKLNFYNDAELSAKMAELGNLLGPAPDDRSVPAIEKSLVELGALCRATLLELGEKPRSARELGIADVVPVEVVRGARERLGLDVDLNVLGTARAKRAL